MPNTEGKKMYIHRRRPRHIPSVRFYLSAISAITGFAGCGVPAPTELSVLDGSTPTVPQLSTGTTIGPKSNNQISLDRDTLDFGSNLAQRWLEINFDGDPALIYVINGELWVDSRIERGRALDDAIRLTIDIDRSQLAIGEHSAILTVGVDACAVPAVLRYGASGALSVLRNAISADWSSFASASNACLLRSASLSWRRIASRSDGAPPSWK